MQGDDPTEKNLDYIIKGLIVPEGGSQIDKLLFLRIPPPPAHRRKALSTRNVRQSEVLGRSRTGRQLPFIPIIIFDKIIGPAHLRKTLAELELEKGEISMEDLQNDRNDSEERSKQLCVVLDVFTDEFGVFRTTHRTTGGTYMNLLNQNFRNRDEPRNHPICGFVPFGCQFEDAGRKLLRELSQLAKGVPMKIDGEVYKVSCLLFVIADENLLIVLKVHVKLLSITSDMAEANKCAGLKA